MVNESLLWPLTLKKKSLKSRFTDQKCSCMSLDNLALDLTFKVNRVLSRTTSILCIITVPNIAQSVSCLKCVEKYTNRCLHHTLRHFISEFDIKVSILSSSYICILILLSLTLYSDVNSNNLKVIWSIQNKHASIKWGMNVSKFVSIIWILRS